MGEKLLDSITTWGKDHNVVIEEDQSVTAL